MAVGGETAEFGERDEGRERGGKHIGARGRETGDLPALRERERAEPGEQIAELREREERGGCLKCGTGVRGEDGAKPISGNFNKSFGSRFVDQLVIAKLGGEWSVKLEDGVHIIIKFTSRLNGTGKD